MEQEDNFQSLFAFSRPVQEFFVFSTFISMPKSRIANSKAAFNKKKNLFTSKLDLNLRKKLVKCYVWSMALYGDET